MPGLNRSLSPNGRPDSSSSSGSEDYASAASNESRGRRKAREGSRPVRPADGHGPGAAIGQHHHHGHHPNPSITKPGYHTFMAFGKEFCIEKRWRYLRELGSGAYGHVISVQDEVTGEKLAVKMVTRVFEKIQLAKRALREITLLRHFNNHENIIGLIDMDVSGPDFNEIYLFMEPMEADLYQIIRSGQVLTNAHHQFFMYQLLRGLKFIHASDVIHRDLKPGNLLVNSDCELKICDMGLSRGYDASLGDDGPNNLTEYVMTRWYRAPEIMLSFKSYGKAIDMWSVGCIFAELLGGKPIFKGKDYVDQLSQILQILGTPSEATMERIGSPKAKEFIRAFVKKQATPWAKVLPNANPEALDLLSKLLTFDPHERLTVEEAMAHPWLAPFHNLEEFTEAPTKFEKWQYVEDLDTTEQFRGALYKEVMEFREEVRNIGLEAASTASDYEDALDGTDAEEVAPAPETTVLEGEATVISPPTEVPDAPIPFPRSNADAEDEDEVPGIIPSTSSLSRFSKDPYRAYSTTRRTSIFTIADRSAGPATAVIPEEGASGFDRSYTFSQSRSRIQSSDTLGGPNAGGVPAAPHFFRQLSTVSVRGLADATRANELVAGHENGAVTLARAADAPASELPSEWGRKGDESPDES